MLDFIQPTTVDNEPEIFDLNSSSLNFFKKNRENLRFCTDPKKLDK